MLDRWCELEIQSITWELTPEQEDLVHFMKYEYIFPTKCNKDENSLVCIWNTNFSFIILRANIKNEIIITKNTTEKIILYKDIFTPQIKEFIPEIHRFV